MAVPGTTSRYNSLQVSVNRRLTHDVQAQVAYTYSRCIDDGGFPIGSLNGGDSPTTYENPYSASIDRGLCFFNVKHALRINTLYPLPFHGNRFKEGWQITGISSATSGYPFSISTGYDRVGYAATGTPRPNYVSGCQVAVGNVNRMVQSGLLLAAGARAPWATSEGTRSSVPTTWMWTWRC